MRKKSTTMPWVLKHNWVYWIEYEIVWMYYEKDLSINLHEKLFDIFLFFYIMW